MSTDTSLATATDRADRPPQANRLRRKRWSDPRLLIGLLVVAGSVVAGARVLATADDTTSVWAVSADYRAGTPVDAGALRSVDVQLSDEASAQYLSTDEQLGGGLVWARDVRAGELVAEAATRPAESGQVAELPVIVGDGAMPSDLAPGDRVDVWVSSATEASPTAADLVLDQMRVLSVAGAPAAMGETAGYRVLLAIEEDKPDRLADALGAMSGGDVTLVRGAPVEAS